MLPPPPLGRGGVVPQLEVRLVHSLGDARTLPSGSRVLFLVNFGSRTFYTVAFCGNPCLQLSCSFSLSFFFFPFFVVFFFLAAVAAIVVVVVDFALRLVSCPCVGSSERLSSRC